mmetsp:Transcript_59172/g.108823  ORF Transcript_59172/g.108823 Transcript_59172/m.108823 type:complete len:207 (+) Transcript_59172:258-878(+)
MELEQIEISCLLLRGEGYALLPPFLNCTKNKGQKGPWLETKPLLRHTFLLKKDIVIFMIIPRLHLPHLTWHLLTPRWVVALHSIQNSHCIVPVTSSVVEAEVNIATCSYSAKAWLKARVKKHRCLQHRCCALDKICVSQLVPRVMSIKHSPNAFTSSIEGGASKLNFRMLSQNTEHFANLLGWEADIIIDNPDVVILSSNSCGPTM